MPSFPSKHKATSSPGTETPTAAADAVQDMPTPSVNMPIPDLSGPHASYDQYEGNDVPSIPPVISLSKGSPSDEEDGDVAEHLDGAFNALGGAQKGFQSYNSSRSLGIVNKSGRFRSALAWEGCHIYNASLQGDLLGAIKTDVSNIQSSTLASPLKTAYESDAMKAIRTGVNALVDNLPGLLKALDEVAKLHPFIGVAVGAFRIVVELDLKRRDNDKKIASLFLQMKDMMEALLQLRSIKDQESIGPDGTTIKARMQELVKQTADDIRACGNACDTYAKKRLIVKVIKGSVWDGTLKGYIDLFAKRRKDFTFALAIHTGAAVDDANRKLDELDTKISAMLEFFALAVNPEQRELAALVQKKGGPDAVLSNKATLAELMKFKPTPTATSAKRKERDPPEHKMQLQPKTKADTETVDILELELAETPEVAITKNLEVFERKFEMQQRELAAELHRAMHHEGDRVIEAVTSGPHDRIIDPDIHDIWKEMRWPGHVKARHFVYALREYYRQRFESKKRHPGGLLTIDINNDDEWALEWININNLQAISEAFDDDASGFITIAEVNQFTSARPQGWSLLHWLAYWAIGWRMTATHYRDEITNMFAKMFSMRPSILGANVHAVQKYFETVYQRVCTLTSSFVGEYQSEALKDRFQTYVDAEEQRLREGLDTVHYDIDAMDTLTLITGPGRIEKSLFPLLYLLLKRDFELFRLAQRRILHKEELLDSADTIVWVFDAVDYRHGDLEALFKQQKLDRAQQFKVHASELVTYRNFDYWHDGTQFWSLKNLRDLEFTEIEYAEEDEDQLIDANELLNYPFPAGNIYKAPDDVLTAEDAQAGEIVKPILGRWHGFIGAERWPVAPMLSFCFHASADHITFEANSVAAAGIDYNITGGYQVEHDGSVKYTFVRKNALARIRTTYFTGALDQEGERLFGNWGYSEDDKPYPFQFFKRVTPEALVARPSPSEFEANKARALWKYALTAVRNEVRARTLSWTNIQERRKIKEEYLELLEREEDDQLTAADLDRFAFLDSTCTFEDVRYFYTLSDYHLRRIPRHSALCDVCREYIYGARLMCRTCGTRWTLDFCDKPECREAVVTNEIRDDITEPHQPTHDFVKVRRVINQYRDIGKILRAADAGLEHARELLDRVVSAQKPDAVHEDPPADRNKIIARPREEAANAADSDSHEHDEAVIPTCVSCASTISYPCWFCIDCPVDSNVFICQTCDEEKGGIKVNAHSSDHSLVRCTAPPDDEEEEEDNTEERLSAVEDKLATLAAQMDRIEKLLESLAVSRSS
ncbi:hypothetical protein BN946_scf184871.g4 [Trametes cinnabarina]|uniref:Uncharacterized protein n=1 Tax=Pycnoporus cinnabarinus TaxID=5643 RepID=A0A060SST7_PYCCI|nr:hypothetical protein BN946_scf184871.g4 [Trametes cinnabarina]